MKVYIKYQIEGAKVCTGSIPVAPTRIHSVLSVFFIVLSASLAGVTPMAPCRNCGLYGIVAELVDASQSEMA